MRDLFEKVQGGFFGQALGDSWAMPALLNPDQTWDYYGGFIEDFIDPPAEHPVHHALKAGQVTDDTEQAAAIAEIMIRDGGLTVEGVAEALVLWYDRIGGDDSPYVGPSSRRAILGIKRGDDLSKVGLRGDTDGAAMRVSPIGLVNPGNLEGAIQDAAVSCIPSHNTDVAISGAAAVAGAIAVAMQPGSTLAEIVDAGVYAAEKGRTLGPVWLGASVARRIRLAVSLAAADKPLRERLGDIYDLVGTSLAMTEAVPAAFGMLVMGEGDPVQAAIYSAALAGDADTVAAMACAIAGAWRGVGAFKADHLALMRRANPWLDFDALTKGLTELAKKKAG